MKPVDELNKQNIVEYLSQFAGVDEQTVKLILAGQNNMGLVLMPREVTEEMKRAVTSHYVHEMYVEFIETFQAQLESKSDD